MKKHVLSKWILIALTVMLFAGGGHTHVRAEDLMDPDAIMMSYRLYFDQDGNGVVSAGDRVAIGYPFKFKYTDKNGKVFEHSGILNASGEYHKEVSNCFCSMLFFWDDMSVNNIRNPGDGDLTVMKLVIVRSRAYMPFIKQPGITEVSDAVTGDVQQ